MQAANPSHRQVVPLRGRIALHTAAIGSLIIAAGAFVAWMLKNDPRPAFAGGAVMFVPTVVLGSVIVGMAAFWQARRAEWELVADPGGVALTVRTARGRNLKRERVAVADLDGLGWVEGDADSSAGLRVRSRTGKGIFIPADSFDCAAFAAFAVGAYPDVVSQELIERVRAAG